MTPLSYDPLDFAAEFSTEMCPEGVVAVSGEKLRIFGVERLGEVFNQAALPLKSVLLLVLRGAPCVGFLCTGSVRRRTLFFLEFCMVQSKRVYPLEITSQSKGMY